MAGSLHGSARTTPRVRAELQASQEKTSILAQRYGLSRTTVTKWRERSTTHDAPMGPTVPRSTVLTPAEEAMVVEFRRRTLLPLDDVLGCLRDSIPKLTRSSLHRCLERHGISRLPVNPDKGAKHGRFASTTIGYVHIPCPAGVCSQTPRGTSASCASRRASSTCSWPSIACPSSLDVKFLDDAGKMNGADFLRGVVSAFPYAIHTVLTDNGMAFADLPKNRGRHHAMEAILGGHIFDRVCNDHGIQHKLTKPYHPWTNGQAERMNRTVKEATIKVFHYPDLESLKAHVFAFVSAYNFAKHLKAIRWKTPFEVICQAWTKTPEVFKLDPRHLIPRPNT